MAQVILRIVRAFARFTGRAVVVLLALAVVATFVPAIPVFGSIGPLLIASFGPWIAIVAVALAIWRALVWRRNRLRWTLAVASLAGLAGLGTAIVFARQAAHVRAQGVDVDLAATLRLRPVSHQSPPPVLETYGQDGNSPLQLVVYRPAGPAKPAPVLVYVHGGGWGGGTIHDRAADWRWFADRGYLVLSLGYTLSSELRPTWDVAEPQLGCALAWINAHADRLGGDLSRLALIGESAGGNLVLNLSSRMASGQLTPACPGSLPKIAAVIAPYPVIDAARMYANTDLVAGPFARIMTKNYTGGTLAQYPQRYAAISSGTHITKAAPPTLLLPGLADHLLPAQVANDYAARAKAAGAKVELIGFPYGEHSFDQSEGSLGSQLFRQVTLRFLGQNGVGL